MSRFVLFSDSASRGWCAESLQCITIKVQGDTTAIGLTEPPATRGVRVRNHSDDYAIQSIKVIGDKTEQSH